MAIETEATFGKVLREVRKERGLSQEALALQAGVERNYISLLERGRNSASVRMLFKLCEVLGLPPSELLRRMEVEMASYGCN